MKRARKKIRQNKEKERGSLNEMDTDKGSEVVGSRMQGLGVGRGWGATEQRVLSLFVGKCLRDGSLLTECVLIHQ